MMQRHIIYAEQEEAMQRIKTEIRRNIWSADTGLPPIAMLIPPVDGSMDIPEGLA